MTSQEMKRMDAAKEKVRSAQIRVDCTVSDLYKAISDHSYALAVLEAAQSTYTGHLESYMDDLTEATKEDQ